MSDNDNDERNYQRDIASSTTGETASGPLNATADDVKGCFGCFAIIIGLAMTAVIVSGLIKLACMWWAA